jgi:hypothetical protein
MTSIDSWPTWIALIVAGGPTLLAIVGLSYSLYMTRCHLEAIKVALKNSRYIYLWGPSLGRRGLIWSLYEMAKIAGMIVWPKASIISGELDPGDLKNFPAHLKHRLMVLITMAFTGVCWAIAVAVLVKFR